MESRTRKSKEGKAQKIPRLEVQAQGKFCEERGSFQRESTQGRSWGKSQRNMFQLQRSGHYSQDCPKSKTRNGGSKVITLNANLAQNECNRLIFLKGKIAKREVLCLLDIGASHNFITRESAERMELHLEELKAPIEVHFPLRHKQGKCLFNGEIGEERWTCWFPPWAEWIAFWEWSSSPKIMCS